jgi:8-oxo-dGTP diphosphatase
VTGELPGERRDAAGGGPSDPPTQATRRLGGLRPRYVRRVTPEHVGQRVSVRHLVDDPDRGPVPNDTVARLLAFDEDAMLLVDRAGQLHVIDPATVLASRVVPAHPRLPAEPMVGTRDQPLVREASRVLLLDPRDRVLLIAHVPAAGRRVWTAPGGGLRPDEDHVAAARRELAEELDLAVELGPWIWTRRETFAYRGVWIDQAERWYLARTDALDAAAAPLNDPGTTVAVWWTLEELAATDEVLAPRALHTYVTDLLAEGAPPAPVPIGR